MDSNRHDAERCLELAEAALSVNNVRKATRLLSKSRRMYPLHTQQDRLEALILSFPSSSAPRSPPPKASTPRPPTPAPDEPSRKPTPAMLAAVRAVQASGTDSHYAVLSVARDAEAAAIKKSYRKLALSLHPDRNCAPGAAEAFKRVGTAFATLSDPKRRDYYDQTGADDPAQPPPPPSSSSSARGAGPRRRHHHQWHAGGTDARYDGFAHMDGQNLTADELFEFLFHGQRMHAPRRVRRQQRARAGGGGVTEDDIGGLFERLKPIVFMLVIFLLAIVVAQEEAGPPFSLHATRLHTERRVTRHNVAYFTGRGGHVSGEKRRRLERDVHQTAYREMVDRCEREREREQFLKQQSQRWLIGAERREQYRKMYERYEKPWCLRARDLSWALQKERGY